MKAEYERLLTDASEALQNIDYCWDWIASDETRREIAESSLRAVVAAWGQLDESDPVASEDRFPYVVSLDELADEELS